MILPQLVNWAKKKGLSLLGTGDFTHPKWLEHLKDYLTVSDRYGIWYYDGLDFILTCEVSNIFSRAGKTYRVHTIIVAPDFDEVEAINRYLSSFGRLSADGRPMLGLDIEKMCSALMKIAPQSFVIFAHIWTPWYSLFGKNSGFNSLKEAFPDGLPENVLGLETGLSSDPPMNWMVSELDSLCLVSNSDAHSPANLGREANVFSKAVDFAELKDILRRQDKSRFLFTVEFFPEEGKYHYDGHRKCDVFLHPQESYSLNNICPVCSQVLTIGVLHRVYDLSDRASEGLSHKIHYRRVVPLREIIAQGLGKGKNTKTVDKLYHSIVDSVAELDLLLFVPEEKLYNYLPIEIAEAIISVRAGNIEVQPGYDGVYGKVKVKPLPLKKAGQYCLF